MNDRPRPRGTPRGPRRHKWENIIAVDGEGKSDKPPAIALYLAQRCIAYLAAGDGPEEIEIELVGRKVELVNLREAIGAGVGAGLETYSRRDGSRFVADRLSDSEDKGRHILKEVRQLKRDAAKARTDIRQLSRSLRETNAQLLFVARLLGVALREIVSPVHRYTLLASSYHDRYIEGPELSTRDCFEFLLDFPKNSLVVSFGSGYDFNMIIKDLPQEKIDELRGIGRDGKPLKKGGGRTIWHEFSIEHRPGKCFSISRGSYKKIVNKKDGSISRKRVWDQRIVIWDFFGFFQMKYVDALENWQIGTREQWERMRAMKLQRGEFSNLSDEKIREYCLSEVHSMATLAHRLVSTAHSVGIRLRRYDGAGAVAASMLEQHGIKNYLSLPPAAVAKAALHAFVGGRNEIALTGPIPGEVYSYDLNSAYPSAEMTVPCLKHGRWRRSRDISRWGLYRVRWDLQSDHAIFGPFPWRRRDGGLEYPAAGETWVWVPELEAALSAFPSGRFDIVDGWVWHPSCDHQPFSWIPEMFAKRRELKAAGDLGEKVLKLGMNALYGKTAQARGRIGKDGATERPPYFSLVWAGLITSIARGQILRAITASGDGVFSIATDGILSTRPIPGLDLGDELGQWEAKTVSDVFTAQSGLYSYVHDGQLHTRTRGFGREEIDWDDLRRRFDETRLNTRIQKQVRRFVGYGLAGARGSIATEWRRWVLVEKTISLFPPTRIPARALHEWPDEGPELTYAPAGDGKMSAPRSLSLRWEDMYDDDPERMELFDQL